MINTDRIVSVTATDLITLYGTILKFVLAQDSGTIAAAQASDPGVFKLTSGSGNLLANEPVKSLDFGSSVTSAVVYFVADYNYEGFSIAGVKATPAEGSVDVVADGSTLYTATLSSGAITIAKVGF